MPRGTSSPDRSGWKLTLLTPRSAAVWPPEDLSSRAGAQGTLRAPPPSLPRGTVPARCSWRPRRSGTTRKCVSKNPSVGAGKSSRSIAYSRCRGEGSAAAIGTPRDQKPCGESASRPPFPNGARGDAVLVSAAVPIMRSSIWRSVRSPDSVDRAQVHGCCAVKPLGTCSAPDRSGTPGSRCAAARCRAPAVRTMGCLYPGGWGSS